MYSNAGGFVSSQQPKYIGPYYDPDHMKRLETTLKKAAAYLDRADASGWESWIKHTKYDDTLSTESHGIITEHTHC